MRNRLMKLAGLLKEDDFELPDKSPFDISFQENHCIYLEIFYPASEYNGSVDSWISKPPILEKIEFKKGNCQEEATKVYNQLYDDIANELEYGDDMTIKDLLSMEQEDEDFFIVHDQLRRGTEIHYFIGPSYPEAKELLNLYNTKGNNTTYQEVRSFLP